MNKIKYAIGAAGLASALLLGAAPVAANGHGGVDINDSFNETVTVDKSQTVNGDCSAILNQDVEQNQSSTNVQTNVNEEVEAGNEQQVNVLPIGSDQNNQATNNQNNSSNTNQSQSNNQSFNADCSQVTNVTEVQQTQAPQGGVDAGAGGFGALAGLGGSLATAGLGALRLRRR